MTNDKDDPNYSNLDALRRYVPLAVWAAVVLTLFIIPLKIIGYGYLPTDDALADAAKAVSGKPWPQILVLGPAYIMDHHLGWHWLLEKIPPLSGNQPTAAGLSGVRKSKARVCDQRLSTSLVITA